MPAFGLWTSSQAGVCTVSGTTEFWNEIGVEPDKVLCGCLQGLLVHNMRYLASVVSNCFTAFGELLALNKRFAELSGGVARYLPPSCQRGILSCVAARTA